MVDSISSVVVFVADDQPGLRSSVKREFCAALKIYTDVEHVRCIEASSWYEAAETIKDVRDITNDFHIGIIDILWPGAESGFETRGIQLLELARRYRPNAALMGISLGVTPSRDLKSQALSAGAHVFRYRAEIEGRTWGELAIELLAKAQELQSGTGVSRSGADEVSISSFGSVDPVGRARTVFVVHGRSRMTREVFSFLECLNLRPVDFLTAKKEAQRRHGRTLVYVKEVLDLAFEAAQAILVLLTPDDIVQLQAHLWGANEAPIEKELTGQARPNVIFEAGLALGREDSRVILVECGVTKPMSDIGGLHLLRLSNDISVRSQLRHQLIEVGCDVDRNSVRWHEVGNLDCGL